MSNQQFETIGKYVLLEKLAMGGMAEVFLARALGAGGISKFFAIKRILPQYADSPEFVEMFREEAKIAINLKHSNIVSIHEFGIQEHQFFLVMDYVEGRNLRQILNKMKKAKQQFSTEHIIYLIREIAAGLDHAHRCIDATTGKPLNITHRDMSPQNIMISFDGEVKIVDFGIAKAESQVETTRAGTLKGKFGYMSPEQAEGLSVDMRTDIFSLGIVMWETLANDRLFAANNEINTLRKIRDCHIPSLRKINPNIHSDLEKIVQKALARDKNLRYQTAAALHKDLNRFLNRQYPDFSSHDFAAYIKSIFAEEILQSRKKLVNYAKNSFAEQQSHSPVHSFDDKTLVTKSETDEEVTSSFVATETGVEPPSESTSPSSQSVASFNLSAITKGGPPISQAEGVSYSSPELVTQGDVQEDAPEPSIQSSASTTIVEDEERTLSEDSRHMEKTSPSHSFSSGQGSHNELEDNEAFEQPLTLKEKPTFNSPPPRPRQDSAYQQNTQTNIPVRHQQGGSSPLLRGMLMLGVVGAVFLGLAKFFPHEMRTPIQSTSGVLGPVYDQLGIVHEQQRASTHPEEVGEKIPAPLPFHGEEPTRGTSAPSFQPAPHVTQKAIGVTSSPSGAEIYINGEKTGLITPTQVTLRGEKATVLLKRKGYGSVSQQVFLAELGNKLSFTLKKMDLSYIDVEVNPLQDATIYVNDTKLESDVLPLRDYPVPANSSITVRVVGANGKALSKRIKLQENEKKLLNFNLGPPPRQPSSR